MNRNNLFYFTSVNIVNCFFQTFYNVRYKGKIPTRGPFVLNPQHKKMADLPLEGLLMFRYGRAGNYIMREFPWPFNLFFEAYGGIPVVRGQDRRNGKYTMEEARMRNSNAAERAIHVLQRGEPLVVHPEGTRHKGIGKINLHPKSILSQIVNAQEEIGDVPFIAVKIEYSGRNIWVRASEPLYTTKTSELEEHLKRELKD